MSDVRVLVVDEDRDVVDLTETFLEREDGDLKILTETDPTAVVDRVTAENVDCVISDLRMPELDGLALFERLEAEAPVSFVLFTAAADDATRERVEAAGVEHLILKGTGTDHYAELAETVRAAVARDD